MWEVAWRRVLQQTPLSELLQLKGQGAPNEEGYLQALSACPLTQALQDCCLTVKAVSGAEVRGAGCSMGVPDTVVVAASPPLCGKITEG